MFPSISIMSRIVYLHVAAVVVTAILMPFALYWFLHTNVAALQEHAMHEQAEALGRHLVHRPDGSFALDLPAALRDLYSEAYGRYAYSVVDEAGQVLFASRKDRAPIFPTDDRPADVELLEARRGNRTVIGVSLHKAVGGRSVWIQVAEDLAHRGVLIDDVVANFYTRVGWITVPILLAMLATDILIFRRAVQPLLRASSRAEHISPTRIDVRLPIDDIPREILPLVTAVNQALDRLEQGFRRQREFTADAAHELRTPLAILRTRIEILPDKDLVAALQQDIERMSRVVGQLLDAAEIETLVVDPGERADLRNVCLDVAEFIAPLALTRGKALAVSGTDDPVWIHGNAEMVSRAVRNLVENALAHTPKGTDVEIVVEAEGRVKVLDRGEGIPAAERPLIFERFWRHDRKRDGGAGLGLSIVKRIMEAHGGTVDVADRPDGGAEFVVTFVPADPPAAQAA